MQRNRWFPLAWAVAACVLLLAIPLYGSARETQTADGGSVLTAGRATLAAVNGSWVYLLLAIPVIAAALPTLPWPARFQRLATLAGAAIASAFVVVGSFSVGLFFLPTAIGLIALARETGSAARAGA